MGFDFPFCMGRVMNSQLLIQLQICLLLIALPAIEVVVVQAHAPIARPGCNDTCGNVSIPFPFGMGAKHCFLDPWFEIHCNVSTTNSSSYGPSSKPFLYKLNIELVQVKLYNRYGYTQSLIVRMPPLNACSADAHSQQVSSIDLSRSPYNFSIEENVFVMEGCAGSAVLVNQSNTVKAGCATVCGSHNSAIPPNSCYGVKCCQTQLSSYYADGYDGIPFYKIDFNLHHSSESQNCLVATLIESDSVNQYAGKLISSDSTSAAPVVLYWKWISNLQAYNDSHASCERYDDTLSCSCNPTYDGNAYISGGCQVPADCKGCQRYCLPQRDRRGSRIPDAYSCDKKPLQLATILGLSISFGVVLLVIALYGLYRYIKRRREMKRRAKFFKRNGGLLLQQQLASNEGVLEGTRIFTISEMEKATNHFNENQILGQGGQGTVYKGMLADGRVVAVKKAKLLDESQLEQFINEVVILSQINHRNVVQMLGCCLETEVPLLVYEFVPNGTLSQHIHDPNEEFAGSWEMRLKIAADSAAAVAYLHSSSSTPIYHRDIKSSNILLDEKYRAKVSDFGSSKTIAIDQTHLTTLVQGTMGYLDPEYFQSYQFTEKSDVYSFGVVLLEILTGKNPIYRDASSMEQKNLVTEFLYLTQNGRVSNILDPKIAREAKEDEIMAIVELARRCISWSGKLRPAMKEVAMTLEMIMKSPAEVCTWYQQQEAIPVQDGGFDEYPMAGISYTEFTSTNTHPGSAASTQFSDVHPLLRDPM